MLLPVLVQEVGQKNKIAQVYEAMQGLLPFTNKEIEVQSTVREQVGGLGWVQLSGL